MIVDSVVKWNTSCVYIRSLRFKDHFYLILISLLWHIIWFEMWWRTKISCNTSWKICRWDCHLIVHIIWISPLQGGSGRVWMRWRVSTYLNCKIGLSCCKCCYHSHLCVLNYCQLDLILQSLMIPYVRSSQIVQSSEKCFHLGRSTMKSYTPF